MNGTIQYSFTPKHLVAEMLGNINPTEELTERQAFEVYGQSWVKKMVAEGRLTYTKGGNCANSPNLYKRLDIERIVLETKYINILNILNI